MLTRIDFHSNVSNRLDYTCRLIRKALSTQCRLIVRLQDKDQQAQFDQWLWQFSATDFLPHVVLNQGSHPLAKHTPVLLTLDENGEMSEFESESKTHYEKILINLSDNVPANFAQFNRLIEIIPQEKDVTQSATPSATQAGRERYRFYQQQGYPLNHINAK